MDATRTEVEPYEAAQARARALAEQMKKKIGAPGGDKIRLTKSKEFILPTGVKSKGPLKGVVVDFVAFNAYYDRVFSEKDKTPPACFALGNVKPIQLVPSVNSPAKQSAKCGIPKQPGCCWANEFGTKGNGKACGNHYLLGFLEPTDDANSPLYLIQTAPKTTRHWETYANGILLQTGMTPIGVETEIYFDPNEDNQVLRFNKAGENRNLAVHMSRQEAVLKRLLSEPDVSGYTPPPPAPGPKR